jgi:hypothetical protein
MTPTESTELDSHFQGQVQRLHQLTMYGQWLFAVFLWVSLGSWSLWQLRYPITLMVEYFTWSAVFYTLVFQPLPVLAISICILRTLTLLTWQIRLGFWGLPKREQYRLEEKVRRIQEQGAKHWLWKWVCEPSMRS